MSSDSPQPSAAPPRRSCLTSTLASIALVAAATLLLLLPTGLIGPVFVVGGIAVFGLFAFHYFVWGRWLNMELKDSDQSSDDPNK